MCVTRCGRDTLGVSVERLYGNTRSKKESCVQAAESAQLLRTRNASCCYPRQECWYDTNTYEGIDARSAFSWPSARGGGDSQPPVLTGGFSFSHEARAVTLRAVQNNRGDNASWVPTILSPWSFAILPPPNSRA